MKTRHSIAELIGRMGPGEEMLMPDVIETARRLVEHALPDRSFTNTQLLNIARPVAIDWHAAELKYPVVGVGSILRSYIDPSGFGGVARQTILVCQPNMVVSVITSARFQLDSALTVCFGTNPFYDVAWMRYFQGDLEFMQDDRSRVYIAAGRVSVEVCPPY